MAKSKKKRNKHYSGTDAAVHTPVVHRYEAVERGRLGDWWVAHKLRVRVIGIAALVALVITLLVSGIAGLFR